MTIRLTKLAFRISMRDRGSGGRRSRTAGNAQIEVPTAPRLHHRGSEKSRSSSGLSEGRVLKSRRSPVVVRVQGPNPRPPHTPAHRGFAHRHHATQTGGAPLVPGLTGTRGRRVLVSDGLGAAASSGTLLGARRPALDHRRRRLRPGGGGRRAHNALAEAAPAEHLADRSLEVHEGPAPLIGAVLGALVAPAKYSGVSEERISKRRTQASCPLLIAAVLVIPAIVLQESKLGHS